MKRLIAFALVLVMVLALCATAFAANPSAALTNSKYKSQTVKRGKTVKWQFNMNCGSYKKKGSTWRAAFESYIAKGGKKGTIYASTGGYFTGKGKQTFQWKIPKTVPTGKYTLAYYTLYRDNKGRWHSTSIKTAKLNVK